MTTTAKLSIFAALRMTDKSCHPEGCFTARRIRA
jgi:hypothetical protein